MSSMLKQTDKIPIEAIGAEINLLSYEIEKYFYWVWI